MQVSASKSESNRLLIIQALAGQKGRVSNLASARDTQTLLHILSQNPSVWDVKDAGTTIRFLTAFAAITNKSVEITGTARMHERPIGILVDALRQLGANIQYLGNAGFPPLKTLGFKYSGVKALQVDGSVSSQFVSALCMVAPLLPHGLNIELTGEPSSIPYIDLTLEAMRRAGVSATRNGAEIQINNGRYYLEPVKVEPDWSSAGYWFSMVALSNKGSLKLPGLSVYSLQADAAIMKLCRQLNILNITETNNGLLLEKKKPTTAFSFENRFNFDFTNCPDMAQTAVVLCSALHMPFRFTGLKSLKVKETDRVFALQKELKTFGVDLLETTEDCYENQGRFEFPAHVPTIHTYHDHRMAMSFAPLALLAPIEIEAPEVVNKSYPEFWQHCKEINFLVY